MARYWIYNTEYIKTFKKGDCEPPMMEIDRTEKDNSCIVLSLLTKSGEKKHCNINWLAEVIDYEKEEEIFSVTRKQLVEIYNTVIPENCNGWRKIVSNFIIKNLTYEYEHDKGIYLIEIDGETIMQGVNECNPTQLKKLREILGDKIMCLKR